MVECWILGSGGGSAMTEADRRELLRPAIAKTAPVPARTLPDSRSRSPSRVSVDTKPGA
ncbi:hypothetical protein Rrhod_2081 [Rhodococcus rhodnii LMG 5362]|uniref:Uncharacterized protein n=1 Tax=Rhodococcus rhodnii LMG 5362 TaxID=1273125 RepID=R7WMJ5_9NOCA|nr:hypothetical protein Rrhod_2081 [Rhodococcus rhodnii LMG 5362]